MWRIYLILLYILKQLHSDYRQVQFWEPLKWISKLRDYNTDQKTILALKTEMSPGHSGVKGRLARLKERAEEYSVFVWLEKSGN